MSGPTGELTWTDLFCGGGGSSLGLHHVPGFHVKYALNHWDLAIQAHQANFPNTDHEVSLIEDVHPRRFQRTDCAWFSPGCPAHAYCGARGVDDESVRSRATMLDVVRWTAHHHYDIVIVENVVEVKLWCDIHPGKNGRACSCGLSFDRWQTGMEDLGYVTQEVHFNSQFALVPQSRDRMYMVFSRVGIPLPNVDFRPPAWCSDCEAVVAAVQTWKRPSKGSARDTPRLHRWGRYGKQYVYTCPACGVPAAPAVVGSWSIIDQAIPIATIGSRARPIAPATRKRIKVGLKRLATSRPVQVQVGGNLFERPGYARVWSLDDPLRTVTTTAYMGMVVPAGGQKAAAKDTGEPSHTVLTTDRLALVRYGGQAPAPRTEDEPMMTMTAHDRQIGVVVQNMTHNTGRSLDEPTGPVTTGGNHMLVTLRDGMDGRSDLEPAAAQATRSDQAIVALRNHGGARSNELPVHAVTAGGLHHGLLVYNGNPGFVRLLEDAAGTVTARDKQSLLVPYNRTAIAHDVEQPLTTVTTHDRSGYLELDGDINDEDIDACLFRMLQWPELQRAQSMHAMPDGTPYQLTARVPGRRAGTFKDLSNEQRVKMIGNAVSSPVATLLGHAVADALATSAVAA